MGPRAYRPVRYNKKHNYAMSILQIATFPEFIGWLFGAIFFALFGLFWYWVSHSFSEFGRAIDNMNDRINTMEKNQVRMEEKLSALRQEEAKLVDR